MRDVLIESTRPSSVNDWLAKWGGLLFRLRSWTPIPFILILLLCGFGESSDLVTWVPGLILIVAGEALRIWGVAVIGKESRTRGSGTGRVVTHGPYAFVRNPLYLGNLLLTLGATCISELLWMLPIMLAMYLIQYIPIVLWEEQNLKQHFGQSYAAYCQRVPRWIPRWSRAESTAPQAAYQWRAAFWSERSTLCTLVVLVCLMLAKENLRHLPKYLRKHGLATASWSFSLPGR